MVEGNRYRRGGVHYRMPKVEGSHFRKVVVHRVNESGEGGRSDGVGDGGQGKVRRVEEAG
jgi:hypothetical protein